MLDCSLINQVGEDLGQRMSYAVTTGLNEYRYVILIGADCPNMSTDYLKQAVIALSNGADAVLGPAEDGGYVLIGLRRTIPCLFDGLPWGTDKVLEMTRDCLRRVGWSWKELPVLWDLDRPEDLSRFEVD
jgi:rSAM/selenodomain-associated transferase 1